MVKSNFSKIEIKILKDLGNKNEVFLQLGSIRPYETVMSFSLISAG